MNTIPEVEEMRAPSLGRRLLAYAPAAAWATLLLVVGSVEHVPTPDSTLPLDKVAHFTGYGILGALAAYGWRWAGRWPGRVLPLLLILALAVIDELHQIRTPGRHGDVADWIADAAGALTGFVTIARFRLPISRRDDA